MKRKIAIYGAGDLGREILVLIRQINLLSNEWEIYGFYDDHAVKGSVIDGISVLGGIKDLNSVQLKINIVFAIASPEIKMKLIEAISNSKVSFPVLVHPGVEMYNFQNIRIGKGSVICAGNIFTSDIHIGEHVLINLACTIGHNCKIEDFCSIMPGVQISGKVNLGRGVYIGTGANLINYINIGKNATIGAGATVINDIQPDAVAVGVPAKIIKIKN